MTKPKIFFYSNQTNPRSVHFRLEARVTGRPNLKGINEQTFCYF